VIAGLRRVRYDPRSQPVPTGNPSLLNKVIIPGTGWGGNPKANNVSPTALQRRRRCPRSLELKRCFSRPTAACTRPAAA
jgi:hypothetical protein